MMQRYNVFSLISTFFVFFFSKACDKDTNLRQMGGKAFKSVATVGRERHKCHASFRHFEYFSVFVLRVPLLFLYILYI